MVEFILFFHDPYFRGETMICGSFSNSDKYRPVPLSDIWINILIKQPAAKMIISLIIILTHQYTPPSDLGGFPPFRKNAFLSGELIEKFRKGQLACHTDIRPTPEEMKPHFNFYHVLLLRPETGHNKIIPAEGIGHAHTVAMLNHLVWFFEFTIEEEQDLQCHYAPGSSFFIRGIIALMKKIIVVGDARWEHTTKN
jgi:hypothetical protein